jgi:hypothetical protein
MLSVAVVVAIGLRTVSDIIASVKDFQKMGGFFVRVDKNLGSSFKWRDALLFILMSQCGDFTLNSRKLI